MNDRHSRFVAAYLTSGNATKAAVAAGYAESRARRTGSDLLRRPDIANEIRVARLERQERTGIDADWAVERYRNVYDRAMSEGGNFSPHGAVAALNGIVKVLGLSAGERITHEHEGEIVYTLRIDPQQPVIDAAEAVPALEL